MWNLDDTTRYRRVAAFALPWAWTFADTRPGFTDREKRERIRGLAAAAFPVPLTAAGQWAFRIFACKTGRTRFDVENVPKLIVDSFCARQISDDGSSFHALALYPDDTLDHVVLVQVAGARAACDSTDVEIFLVEQPVLRTPLEAAGITNAEADR